ncbi:MAG: hypothetical protein ACLFPV_07045 [Spirochaetaceae bacterium]
MFDSSLVRFLTLLAVMLVVGFGRYAIAAARLRKRGEEDAKAKSQAKQSAKKYSLIAAFLYMVAMVSVAGLFI